MGLLIFQFLFGGVVLSLAGAFLVRRFAPHEVMEEHKEVAGFLYGVVGAIYAVLLALAVVGLWEEFREAEETADREASKVMDLIRLTDSTALETRLALQGVLYRYVERVLGEEWPAMAQGIPIQVRSREVDEMWEQLRGFSPASDRDLALWEKTMDALVDLTEARRARALSARQGLPRAMWAVLIAGAVLTVGFSYFFRLRNASAQAALTAMLAMSLMLQLFLLSALEYPFSGGVRVEPRSFELLLEER